MVHNPLFRSGNTEARPPDANQSSEVRIRRPDWNSPRNAEISIKISGTKMNLYQEAASWPGLARPLLERSNESSFMVELMTEQQKELGMPVCRGMYLIGRNIISLQDDNPKHTAT